MQLNSLDILVLIKIHTLRRDAWSQTSLARDLLVAQSQVHASLVRASAARLFLAERKVVLRSALAEFLVHGVKYAFPPRRGGPTRGLPTGYAAPPLSSTIVQPEDLPPVWPHPHGTVAGYEFEPLDKRVPEAALRDAQLYEMLALVDAIREGRAREVRLAAEMIDQRLRSGE